MTLSPTIRLALQKLSDAQAQRQAHIEQTQAKRSEENMTNKMIQALEGIGKVTSLQGPKGDPGYTPIRGIDYFTEQDVRILLQAATPIKGTHYFDGESIQGEQGPQGEAGPMGPIGKSGVDGEDGADVDMAEVIAEAKKVVDTTLKNLPKQDSFLLAGKKVSTTELQDKDILQYNKEKDQFEFVKLPKKEVQPFFSGGGPSASTRYRIKTVTASTVLDPLDQIVYGNAGGNITITLPSAAGQEGTWLNIKKLNASNTITIAAAGSDTIDGLSTVVLTQQYTSLEFVSNGVSSWLIK